MMAIIQWLQHWSTLAMFAVFAVIVAVTFWSSRKQTLEQQGRIPLDDEG